MKETAQLKVLDNRAAFVDVGSEKMHVSIAGAAPQVFGTMTGDLQRLRDWLKEQKYAQWPWRQRVFTGCRSIAFWKQQDWRS
jgi:hypothetical protein